MKLSSRTVVVISLVTLATGAFGQTDAQPKLPTQYAEVVLHVEGMT